MNRLSVEEFHEAKKMPLVVVLDDVRSMYNVGSVFRTSDAFRAEAVYLCGITATPPHNEIHKTALGAEDSVEWKHFDSAEDAVNELHEKGYYVFSIEQVEGSTKLQDLQKAISLSEKAHTLSADSSAAGDSIAPKGYAVVFGNEVKGVSQTVVDMSDNCLEIPQFGTKHSLNVSVTAGIVIYEFSTILKEAME